MWEVLWSRVACRIQASHASLLAIGGWQFFFHLRTRSLIVHGPAPLHSICIYRARACNWAWQLASHIFSSLHQPHQRWQVLDNFCILRGGFLGGAPTTRRLFIDDLFRCINSARICKILLCTEWALLVDSAKPSQPNLIFARHAQFLCHDLAGRDG